ncbi:glycine cleavage system protein GcvH [bacterium]|nr:MAG: glycine cleavage system protein GcvH [bacterium]
MDSFPQELKYTDSHEYVLVEGNTATIGITDYAAEKLGDIVYVELPRVGDVFTAGQSFGVIESVKSVSDLYAPVGGKVVAVNDSLSDHPELITEDSYERGWILKIEMEDAIEAEGLMNSDTYASHVTTES